MQTSIRQPLKEQSDHDLRCLPFRLYRLDNYSTERFFFQCPNVWEFTVEHENTRARLVVVSVWLHGKLVQVQVYFKLFVLNYLSRLMTTNKMACAPSEDSDQPGHPPSLIRVFAVRIKKTWVLSYPLSAQRRL